VDESRLTLMMMQKVVRTITKDGFRHLGSWYWHEALASRRHEVLIRYDEQFSRYTALVYTLDGEFLCEARDREHYKIAAGLHPAAKALGTLEQVQDLSDAIALKKRQEKLAGANMQTMLDVAVMPEVQRMRAQIIAFDAPARKAALPEARKPAMSAETIAAIEAVQSAEFDTIPDENAYKPAALCRFRDGLAKYEYLFRIKFEQGIELIVEDQAWLEAFEATPEFARYQRRFDQMREVFAQWRSA
jgi:putative transposase